MLDGLTQLGDNRPPSGVANNLGLETRLSQYPKTRVLEFLRVRLDQPAGPVSILTRIADSLWIEARATSSSF